MDRSKSGVKICLSIAVEGYAAYRKKSARKDNGFFDEYVDLGSPQQFFEGNYGRVGVAKQKVLFLPHGMPHTLSGRVRHIRQDEPLRFAYIGSLSRHKGVHVLLEAFRGVDGANLAIYGRRDPDFYVNFGDVLPQGNVAVKGIVAKTKSRKFFQKWMHSLCLQFVLRPALLLF